jgi:hypothetical protein
MRQLNFLFLLNNGKVMKGALKIVPCFSGKSFARKTLFHAEVSRSETSA